MRDISLVKFLPIEPKVPFISGRKIAAVLSVLAIIASIFLFFSKGLNYGIDFTGGTVLEIDTGSDPTEDDIRTYRDLMNSLNLGSVGLQTIKAPCSDEERADGTCADKYSYLRITIPIQEETVEREGALIDSLLTSLDELEGDNFSVDSKKTNDRGFTSVMVSYGNESLADEFITTEAAATETGTVEAAPGEEDLEAEDPKITEIKKVINSLGLNNAEVNIRSDNVAEILYQKKEEASATVQQLALGYSKLALAKETGSFGINSQSVLGSKVSGELRRKGIMAVVIALFMVLAYIWFRFEWQFALGAVIALFHDVILTIGVFSLTQLEFNLSIIAAILTIVGYSLNDTVIVYDRIRENMRKYKKMPMIELINLSINDTLSRTIMTSFTTLMALLALYLLGGEGLEGFAFAMIWGVFVGTYSSIFVASPLLLLFKLRNVRSGEVPQGSTV